VKKKKEGKVKNPRVGIRSYLVKENRSQKIISGK
jgi:hypothetical protein